MEKILTAKVGDTVYALPIKCSNAARHWDGKPIQATVQKVGRLYIHVCIGHTTWKVSKENAIAVDCGSWQYRFFKTEAEALQEIDRISKLEDLYAFFSLKANREKMDYVDICKIHDIINHAEKSVTLTYKYTDDPEAATYLYRTIEAAKKAMIDDIAVREKNGKIQKEITENGMSARLVDEDGVVTHIHIGYLYL